METVKVDEIVRNARKSYDFPYFNGSVESWKELLKYKLGHSQVPALIRSIQENGFTMPIFIEKHETGWSIGNGHHRLSIAILLGIDEVPITNNWNLTGVYENSYTTIEDSKGAYKLSHMVETAIDWENWPELDKNLKLRQSELEEQNTDFYESSDDSEDFYNSDDSLMHPDDYEGR